MTKKNKTVLAVLAVVLVIGIVFVVLTGNGIIKKAGLNTSSGKSLSELETVSFKSDYPLVQTQQADLFYSPYPDGTIKYYRFDGNGFKEVTDGISTKTAELECSYQKVKVKLYYLKTDVGTVGYGLYTPNQEGSVKLFSYILVRMMDCPAAYKNEVKQNYILLTDMDAEDAYKPDKTYSDMYAYNIETGKTTLVLSQRDRTAQLDGTVNEGWTIFTDSSLNAAKKCDIFASLRINDATVSEKQYCFMNIANTKSMKKAESAKVTGCPSYEVREKDGNYFCFATSSAGFDLIKNGDKKNPIKSFTGSFSDYCVSGDWIYNKTSGEFTSITTGESKSINNSSVENVSGFAANADGTKFTVFTNGEKQAMVMYDMQKKNIEIVTDKLFDNGIRNFCFIDGEHGLFSSYDESGAAVNTVYKF